jgi:uncharacterized membrane protein
MSLRSKLALTAATVILPTVLACGSGTGPLSVVDPEAAPAQPTYDEVVFILERHCLSCHGGSAARTSLAAAHPSRHGDGKAVKPAGAVDEDEDDESTDYSSCAGIQAGLEGILGTAVRGNSMPPGALPRLTQVERLVIDRWIDQGACSPCTVCP